MVAELLGSVPERLCAFRPPVGGDDSFSYRFSVRGVEMLLKIKRRGGSPVGIYFYQSIRRAGIPVPDLIRFSRDGAPDGQACAIWSWVDGTPAEWGPGEPCPYDEAEFGSLLRRIHQLSFQGAFGLLGDDIDHRAFSPAPGLRPTSETWAGFFDCEDAARRYRDKGYLDAPEAKTLSGLSERMESVLRPSPCRLLHMGDIMHNGNMLIGRDGQIAAVIDYVESTAGDPRWELAWIDYYFSTYPFRRPSFDMARFRSAYGTNHDPNDLVGRFYLLAILLFEKLLFFDPSSPRGRWAIETAKEIVSSL